MGTRGWLSTAGIASGGTLSMLLGAAGLFLPVIPGVVLIAGGLTLLARRFAWAERLVSSVRSKLPDRRTA